MRILTDNQFRIQIKGLDYQKIEHFTVEENKYNFFDQKLQYNYP